MLLLNKQTNINHNNVHHTNGKLRKTINAKNILKRKFDRSRTENCELYRKHRNITVKFKKKSFNVYMQHNRNVINKIVNNSRNLFNL